MSSDELRRAATLLAGRYFRSADAPFGVVGSAELGTSYVRTRHPDVEALLLGQRTGQDLAGQVWPTVDEVAVATLNTPAANLDPVRAELLAQALAAAVEWITVRVRAPFGVA